MSDSLRRTFPKKASAGSSRPNVQNFKLARFERSQPAAGAKGGKGAAAVQIDGKHSNGLKKEIKREDDWMTGNEKSQPAAGQKRGEGTAAGQIDAMHSNGLKREIKREDDWMTGNKKSQPAAREKGGKGAAAVQIECKYSNGLEREIKKEDKIGWKREEERAGVAAVSEAAARAPMIHRRKWFLPQPGENKDELPAVIKERRALYNAQENKRKKELKKRNRAAKKNGIPK